MTYRGWWEIFDSRDKFAGKFSLVSMGGLAEGLAFADPGARTPIGNSGNFLLLHMLSNAFHEINKQHKKPVDILVSSGNSRTDLICALYLYLITRSNIN